MKSKSLSAKEKLFCTYYCLSRNGREAAAKAGYRLPEKNSLKLLDSRTVREEIARIDKRRASADKAVAAGYYRLAFGCVSDAVSLLFSDELSLSDIEKMDLFNISDIKRPKGGGFEIKFFDRLKALERLYELSCQHDSSESNPFYEAIEKGAAALNGENELE